MRTSKTALLAVAFAALGLVITATGPASASQYNPSSPCDVAPHGFTKPGAYGDFKDSTTWHHLYAEPAAECSVTDELSMGPGRPIGCETTNYYGDKWYWIGADEKTADGGWSSAANFTNIVGTPSTCY